MKKFEIGKYELLVDSEDRVRYKCFIPVDGEWYEGTLAANAIEKFIYESETTAFVSASDEHAGYHIYLHKQNMWIAGKIRK